MNSLLGLGSGEVCCHCVLCGCSTERSAKAIKGCHIPALGMLGWAIWWLCGCWVGYSVLGMRKIGVVFELVRTIELYSGSSACLFSLLWGVVNRGRF